MKHELKLTSGHVNPTTYTVEPPWKCSICQKYFMRYTKADTCEGKGHNEKSQANG